MGQKRQQYHHVLFWRDSQKTLPHLPGGLSLFLNQLRSFEVMDNIEIQQVTLDLEDRPTLDVFQVLSA